MNSSKLVSRILLGTFIGLGSLALGAGDASATEVVGECQSAADCEPNQACVSGDGMAPYCACQPGFQEGIYGCDDINECFQGLDGCSDNAACTNRIGTYTCSCNPGFEGDGETCTSTETAVPDECASAADCEPNMACVTGEGPAYCACEPGYRDGMYGCDDINECWEGTDNCSDNAACVNRIGSFTCACNPGFKGDGVKCTGSELGSPTKQIKAAPVARKLGSEGLAQAKLKLSDDADDADDAAGDEDTVSDNGAMCSAGAMGGTDLSAVATVLMAAGVLVSRRRKG